MKKLQKNILTNVFTQKLCWIALIITVSFASCKKETGSNENADKSAVTDEASAVRFKIPHRVVHPGSSIQEAVNIAAPGTVIFIEPGTYTEAIIVNKPGIQLIGTRGSSSEIIIQNPGDEENGITVNAEGDGFVLKNGNNPYSLLLMALT
jgi:pectin methylesterase-like acyl-CoA thioesterase